MTRNYQKIKFPTIAPNSTSLQWHYNMSVIENMGCKVVQWKRRSKATALAKDTDSRRNKWWGEQSSLGEQDVRTLSPRPYSDRNWVAQCFGPTGAKLFVSVFKPLTKQIQGYVWVVFRCWNGPRNRIYIKSLWTPRNGGMAARATREAWDIAARAVREAWGIVVESVVLSRNQWSNGTPQNNQWIIC